MRRIVVLAALTVAGLLAIAPGSASADTAFAATAQTPNGRLAVHVAVNRFFATAAGTEASGKATATLTPPGGAQPATISKEVTLAATSSGTCTVLTLNLEELNLDLLGLNVHLEKVLLHVTGESHGGVLGSLFCSLAHAKVKAARVAAARRIDHAIRKSGPVQPLAFAVDVHATQAATGPTCPVLDLVLGPLNLDLLGLVVDLNKVHLTITAEPAGGALGSLFCSLSAAKLG